MVSEQITGRHFVPSRAARKTKKHVFLKDTVSAFSQKTSIGRYLRQRKAKQKKADFSAVVIRWGETKQTLKRTLLLASHYEMVLKVLQAS